MSILTGKRCTTLTKLPVAFCGGKSARVEPVPLVKPEIRPSKRCLPPYMSTSRSTCWPMRRFRSCVSLKFASTQMSPSERPPSGFARLGRCFPDSHFVASPLHQFPKQRPSRRSEEHTSELQSHSDLVCRLLLE